MIKRNLILLLPVIGIIEVGLSWQGYHFLDDLVYLEMIVICLCGWFGVKRDMWLFLTLFYSWVALSNLLWDFPQWLASVESGLFFLLVGWILWRPERIPSDPPSDTVQIAFYYGDKSPFIARIMSLIGLPVTGIAVIIGDWAIVPIGKTGKLEKRPREALRKWIKLDTNLAFDHENYNLWREFLDLEGKPVSYAGCMDALSPILIRLNCWSPLDTPSSLMSKVLAMRK